ncbi:hypothetical protein N9003_00610 [bacterium]|nr:hypothetical protein [bacterium]
MNIQIYDPNDSVDLEEFRPTENETEWDLIASGDWQKSPSESVTAALLIAENKRGQWIVDCVQHNSRLGDYSGCQLHYIRSQWLKAIFQSELTKLRTVLVVGSEIQDKSEISDIANELYNALVLKDPTIFSPNPDHYGLLINDDPYVIVENWYIGKSLPEDIDYLGFGCMKDIVASEIESAKGEGITLDAETLKDYLQDQFQNYLENHLLQDFSEEEQDANWRFQVEALECIIDGGYFGGSNRF